ncbi:MAG: substrate-binding domain-containing protein [Candidatus Methylumidiphilus sp.]
MRVLTGRQWFCKWRIAIVICFSLIVMPPADALEIVVNREVSTSQLSRGELQAIFTMRVRVWPDGLPIKVFVLSDNTSEQSEFAKKILDIFPYQLRRYWDRLVFSGTGQAPIELASPGEMYNRIATTPGAIGYLTADYIGNQVRIIKVNNP